MKRGHAIAKPQSVSRRSAVEALESRLLLSASQIVEMPLLSMMPSASASAAIQGYTPSQIETAYGINKIAFSGASGTGAGQTIAIVDAYNDPNITADLGVFDKQFGLAAPPSFVVESQTASTTSLPTTDAGWATEISLDVEWAHAIAPAAKILLVEANSDSLNDLLSAVNTARDSLGVTTVSMSWGGSEFSNETSYDSYFTTPAGHKQITFVAASGDEGQFYGPEWPASSPNVLSVGGTTLTTASSGAYASEAPWADSTGGYSYYENQPSYQSSVANVYGSRSTPDVAFDADPNSGVAIYDSLSYEGYVGWQEVGGTSAGAPSWAAIIAIANQGRQLAGESPLNGTTGTLPALYQVYSTSNYDNDFNDVTWQEQTGGWWRHSQTTTVTEGVGYDVYTGLGSPKAVAVINVLIGTGSASSSVTASVSRARSSVIVYPGDRVRGTVASQPLVSQAQTAMQHFARNSKAAIVGLAGTSLARITSWSEPVLAGSIVKTTNLLVSPIMSIPSVNLWQGRWSADSMASERTVERTSLLAAGSDASASATSSLLQAVKPRLLGFGWFRDGWTGTPGQSARRFWDIFAAVGGIFFLVLSRSSHRRQRVKSKRPAAVLVDNSGVPITPL